MELRYHLAESTHDNRITHRQSSAADTLISESLMPGWDIMAQYAPVCLLLIGGDQKIQAFTPHAFDCLREVLDLEIYTGMDIANLMIPGNENTLAMALSEAFAGKRREVQLKHKGKFNQLHYFQVIFNPVTEGEGIKRVVVTCNDVTSKILLAEARRRSRHATLLFQSIPLPAFIYDPENLNLLKVNKKFNAHYGYTEAEIAALTVLDLHPGGERELVIRHVLHTNRKEEISIREWRHCKKDGTLLHVEAWGSFIKLQGKKLRLVIVNDITEKVETEAELRASNERFSYVASATSDIVWDWNLKAGTILWSDHYQYILGWRLPPSRTLSIDHSVDCLHPDDRERVVNNLHYVFKHTREVLWENAFKYRRSDGSYAQVLNKSYIIRNERGRVVRVIGALHDISEQQYQQDLQELELKVFSLSWAPQATLSKVLEALAEGLGAVHDGGKACILLYANDKVKTVIAPGLKIAALNSLRNHSSFSECPSHEISGGAKAYDLNQEFAQFLGMGNSPLGRAWVVPVQQGDDELLAELILIVKWQREPSNLELNAILRIQNLLRTLLVHQASLEQIRQANERFDNAMKATHDLIWDCDLENNRLFRSPDAELRVFGKVDSDCPIKAYYNWLDRIHPDDRKNIQNFTKQIQLNPGLKHFELEYRILCNNGSYAYFYDRGIVIRNESGKVIRIIGAAQDITERKRLEQKLLKEELDRQKVISQATLDTQEQERAEIGKELHDNVNQILTTTKLYLDLVQGSPEMKDELLVKASKNIMHVINEIRQLSRSLMDPSLGDLGLVESVKDLIENINLTRRIAITLRASEKLEQDLDKSRKLMVFRIIQEAVSNIIRHAQASKASIVLKKADDWVVLQISDNGTGFNPDQVQTGVGLKNIRNRLYLKNGSCQIISAPTKGTTLDIKFPISKSSK